LIAEVCVSSGKVGEFEKNVKIGFIKVYFRVWRKFDTAMGKRCM
jgi:hypothetical protein